MKKNSLLIIIALVSSMGAFAKVWEGKNLSIKSPQAGDSVTLSSTFKYSYSPYLSSQISFEDTKSFRTQLSDKGITITDSASHWLACPDYADYRALNGNDEIWLVWFSHAEERDDVHNLFRGIIKGHFTGFYTKTELAANLDVVYNATVNKISEADLATFKTNVANAATATEARALYDSYVNYMKLFDAKVSAKAAIDTQVAAEKRADVSSIADDYKSQIDAATTCAQVASLLSEAQIAIDQAAANALAQAKQDAKSAIDNKVKGYTDEELLNIASNYKGMIDVATSVNSVNTILPQALTELQNRLNLIVAKENAIAEINTALDDITDATLLATIQGYKDQINAATDIAAIAPIKEKALADIAVYKAEQERQRQLEEAKEDAIVAITSLLIESEDDLVSSVAIKYIALIEAATVIEDVTRLRSEAESLINRLLTEPDAFEFGFTGANMPAEKQHALDGVKMTYSPDGELMTVTINGASVTYPLSQVGELSHFRGTPAVELTTHENPADPGYYYTTFYSGLEAYDIPDGVQAYTAELTSAINTVTITPITGNVLPQDEAVLLESTSAEAIKLVVTDPATGTKAMANSFEGVDMFISRPEGSVYLLSDLDNMMAFYLFTGDIIPANNAFIHIPAGMSAPDKIVWKDHSTPTGDSFSINLQGATDNEKVEKFIHNGTLYIRKGEHVYNAQGVIVK